MVFIPSTCSRITSRTTSRVWCGVIWQVHHLRADSVVWLSHMSRVWPWSGAPKVHLYDTFLGDLRQSLVSSRSFLKEDFGRTSRNPAAWMVAWRFAECENFLVPEKNLACANFACTTNWMVWYRFFLPLAKRTAWYEQCFEFKVS